MDMEVERGLKCEIKRQVGLKNFQGDKADHRMEYLIRAWQTLQKNGIDVSAQIWEFVETSPSPIYTLVNTKVFGIYSRLDMYENKKGVRSLAHYTINGRYLGLVKKLGEIPIAYDGMFPITRKQFRINPTKIQNMKEIADVFVAINLEEKQDEKEEEDGILYWGATNGHLTIWRVPHSVLPDPCDLREFSQKIADDLGEEWGELNTITYCTITKEMLKEWNLDTDEDTDED